MKKDNRKKSAKSGFTLIEAIIVLAITGVLLGALIVGITRIAKQAYLNRANDSAEVIYMALQSAVTDLKTQGRFDAVFADEYLGDPHHGAADNPDARFYAVPDAVLDGNASVSGAKGTMGGDLTAAELQELKDKKSLIYMVLNKNDGGTAVHPDSDLLKELLNPYISDGSILEYSILVEVNRNNKTVRAAFYGEKTPELTYVSLDPDDSLKDNKADVYFRERVLLDQKDQGYYGTLAVGENEDIGKLDNAYVKIYNDDMLTVEWGEFFPAGLDSWEEKKKILPGMTYDVYLVNAVDTSKIYYKIENITPYHDNDDYILYMDGRTNHIPSDADGGEFTGNVLYGTTRIPVYDLFRWEDVSYGIDPYLMAASFTTLEYEAGVSTEVAMGHRLSYLPGTGDGEPGCFRLVLDSLTEAGHDDFSISKNYPKLLWDENFTVIVEGKYHDQGFTGSMSLCQDIANPYTEEKGLYNRGILNSSTERGVSGITEFINYAKNRLSGGSSADSYWWYEVAYGRHLNNLRYIVGDNAAAEPERQGKNQNLLVTGDIDWSLQRIGRTENENGSFVHRMTVANTVSSNLHDAATANLKVFVPLSTGDTDHGFSGLLQSERYFDSGDRIPGGTFTAADDEELTVYEPYVISGLKLAKDTGGTDNVEPDLSADHVGLFESVAADGEISHLILSGITVIGNDNIGSFAGLFRGKAENLTVLADEDVRWMKIAVQSGGVWTEQAQMSISPWNYPSAALWQGNRIAGENGIGGLFGVVEKETSGVSGDLRNLANGTVYANQHLNSVSELNGISVVAGGAYAGGIAGFVNTEVQIRKVVNTGDISGSEYVGGIAGFVQEEVCLDGTDPADAEPEYQVKRYLSASVSYVAEYQNYGRITAGGTGPGSYAGGIVGMAKGSTSVVPWGSDKYPILSNLRNVGYVTAEQDYAGGIAGALDTAVVYNVQNGANIHAKNSYAGGIAGALKGESRMEGAQNLAPENHTGHTGVYAALNDVSIYAAKEDSAIPAGVSAREYAGGIAGSLSGKSQINALSYLSLDIMNEDKFIKADGSSAETGIEIVLNRQALLERMSVAPGSWGEFMPLANYAQITGVSQVPESSESLGTSFFIGGIAGAVTEDSLLNHYSEDHGWLAKVPMRNEGNITARYGSYVGGIAGAAAGSTKIYNAENGQKERVSANDGVVIQALAYAGGLIGAVDSESAIVTEGGTAIGTDTKNEVMLSNSEQLAWEGSSIAEEYYTNNARLVIASELCAGGIVGSVNTDLPIANMFNGGTVKAGMEAGGLFGAVSGNTSTEYHFETLSKRMVRGTNTSYAVNSGAISAGTMAGGIAGAVISPNVQLRDVFNSGNVTTETTGFGTTIGDYAGGIIGYVVVENPGTDGEDGVIRHSDSVISGIVMSSDGTVQRPVYTNTGNVYTSGSYAGGIVGQGSISLADVFNAGEIQANDSYAGGIAGELVYAPGDPGMPITVAAANTDSKSDAMVQEMLSYAAAEYDKDFSLYQNRGNVSTVEGAYAGGIAGSICLEPEEYGDKIHVTDMYNAGHVAAGLVTAWSEIEDVNIFSDAGTGISTYGADSISAGGIIGRARGVILEYRKDVFIDVLSGQDTLLSEDKFLPNMGNVLARHEAGGLIGSAAGAADDIEYVLVLNGANRGIVRAEEESAGGLVGQGIWMTVKTEAEVAAAMLETKEDPDKESFSNLAVIIAGTDNAGGIAGKLENSIITDIFNRGEVYAGNDNAGGVIGYARNSDADLVMEISHTEEIADHMFENADLEEYTFTNTASITAGGNNAGGIAGKVLGSVKTDGGYYVDSEAAEKAVGKIILYDVYSGDPTTKQASDNVVIEAKNNAGGMVGRFADGVICNEYTVEMVLQEGIYTNNAAVTAKDGSNAGGIIGNADERKGSLEGTDTRTTGYSTNPTTMETYVDSNHFQIADVYNIGKVTADAYNAGGIFGLAAAGTYHNNPEYVALAVEKGMLTNIGDVVAKNNAGGIFGAATAKFDTNELYAAANTNDEVKVGGIIIPKYETPADILDVFNGGSVNAKSNNAGGIAGLAVHLDLRYSEATLEQAMKANDPGYLETFLAANTGNILAGGSYAGGIIGNGYQCILQDVFNTGTEQSLKAAMEQTEDRVTAGGSYAGGIIGQANGLKLFYSDTICENIRKDRSYVYSNVANVKAGSSNAGGIAGYAYNSIQILDAYNMGAVEAVSGSNAGGIVGWLNQNETTNRDNTLAVITSDSSDPLSPIDIANNTTLIRSAEASVAASGKYRGEDFITFENSVSYVTFTTIVTGTEAQYEAKTADESGNITTKTDSFGNVVYTNRYTSMSKSKIGTAKSGYHIIAGGSNAGGIIGYASANSSTQGGNAVMDAERAILRVENVFSAGSTLDPEIGGVWAKGSNAGGIIGEAQYAHLTYSFDINPGPDGLDVGGTDEANSKGDHSVMTEAFNDPRVMKDPYAIKADAGEMVGLHLVANSAKVRASAYGPNQVHGNTGVSVNISTGAFTNLTSKNAGGAIGSMTGGRAERLYSLKGDVVTPTNLGGIAGYATDYAMIRQASRMGVYNQDKYHALEEDGEYNIYTYESPDIGLVKVDLDGVDILAGTQTTDASAKTVKLRGSMNVGGIVGFADNATEILDTRNLVQVEGRAYVGGVVGQAGKNVNITLAHNMQNIIGRINSPEDDAHKDTLITVNQMTQSYLDRSAVDGCYIGGIVGKTYDTAGTGNNPTSVMMAKNDPLMTQNFEERLTEEIDGRPKDVRGGNFVNSIDGRKYVGGITGAHGVVNYAVNTGRLTGVQYVGGISGQGYRVTNSFNTADINAENNYLYSGQDRPVFSQAVFVGGIAGQIGHRNNVKLQIVESGSYIKNSYNASSRVNGASIVGGIAGYAIAPIETTYNSAAVSTEQSNLGNSGNETAETGNKVGGIVGQTAQDKADKILIIDSYSSGIVGGTGDTGGILGFVEYYADGEIVNETELRKRIKNSYFIKDSSVRYYSILSGRVSMEINATLRALNLDVHYPIDEFVYATATASNLKDEHVVDSEYGARNYSNMISNEYIEYRNLLQQTVGGGAGLTGETDLQNPLNTGKNLAWQGGSDITQESSSNIAVMGTAKFVFPYDSSGSGSGDTMQLGRDYEFLHLDFSGANIDNEQEIPGIQLNPGKKGLEDSNQWFVSGDNTATSNLFNVWPTSVINYMKADVAYDDGGGAEDTVYHNNGTSKTGGLAKAALAGQVNAIGVPLWQVNYNYTGTTGSKDNYVPTSVFTPETLTLTGRFSEQGDKLPRIMKFNIYDGYSRGDYFYDNSDFTVKMVESQIQKTYVLINEDEWNAATASWSNAAPGVSKEVTYQYADGSSSGRKFYFYIENNVSTDDMEGVNAADIMELIDVKLQLQPAEPGADPEIEWKITIPSMEMDTYLGAKSGFFTAEAIKIYDESDSIAFDNYTTWERTSRMFSMHFANYYGSKDSTGYGSLDYNHNRSIFDQYPNLDLDEFEEGMVTKAYEVTDSAALGSVKLTLATSSNAAEYIEQVPNRLQIANERHLYNLNKNQNQGTAEIDSYLPYVNKDIQLIRDVELSADNGYNCFIIGLSKGSFKRMTGSLDGMGMDGKIHTIGNLQVDMDKTKNLPKDLSTNCYGLIYDLSGGVVKNLQIGSDSRIRAEKVGALAFQASNGKSGTDVLNNPWYENLEPELRIEEGKDAKIYNTRVNADISGQYVGGYVYHTVRRFESSQETRGSAARDTVDTLTITNSQFGGKINTIKGSHTEDRDVEYSVISAGFLCMMYGKYDDNNLLESAAGGNYSQNTYVNGSEVTEDAYIYGKEYAAGIAGAVDNISQAQAVVITKSANNGTVVSTKRANGISQGILENDGTRIDKSGVDVWYSYNNGIVQTPNETGLASGIGNIIRVAAYSTNNGTVIGRIASGISNYGAKDMKIMQCANNGYVRGKQIAGGIVAAPARWDSSKGKALPYRLDGLALQLDNCYNTGTVVVTTNIDDSREDGSIDVIYNSYAGGIIGMAVLYDRQVDWFKTTAKYYLSEIEEDDDRKTVLRNCYNAGRVYYEENGSYSLNHRYLGGIAGGGLHRFVDIQNCYSLSDSEAMVGTIATMYRADVDLGSYTAVTPSSWKQVITPREPAQDKAYNYNLTAVGDMPYGSNVAAMAFADMLNLENFIGFNSDAEDIDGDGSVDLVWMTDHDTADVNGYIYPFPQFNMLSTRTGEMYVGDDYQAEVEIPDAVFNVNINKEKFRMAVSETAKAILIADVTDKTLIPAAISYREVRDTGELGAFDRLDATQSNANPVEVVRESRYTIELARNAADYDVYVYDGDADAADYAPAMIRRYEVRAGTVTSGGKLHDEQSTLLHEMQYFNTAPGGADYAAVTANTLTIGDKEEIGWYMPIHGYYTVVVAERGSAASVAVPEDYNSRIRVLAKVAATKAGGIAANSLGDSSQRFQVHFAGESIEGRNGTYASGSAAKPYKVTDQYSVIGMTTAGIARNSTDRKHFQQVNNIVITEHVLPMFEFNGIYDGANPAYSLGKEPAMNGNFTISYRTGKGDFGFINYLAPTSEALNEGFIPTVSNLNILVEADGEYSNQLGRYFEAANYTTALGLVADYAEYAKLKGITTLGNVVYGDTDPVSYRSGFYGDGSVPLGGVVGIMKNTVVERAKNNAALGVKLTPQKSEIDGIEVSWTQHANPAKGVQVAGIAAVAVSNNSSKWQVGRMEYVFNNGELRAAYNRQAAGIAHTVSAADMNIRYAANSGWVRAMNGTAAGLVYSTLGKLEDAYNSGLVTAGSVKGMAAGEAVGLFWSVSSYANVDRLYNAGVVRGNKQGAITQGTDIRALEGRVYYLKDEDLYWMDSSSLPDSMEITDEKQVELYLGFAYVPVELYGFSGDEAVIKAAEAASAPGIYDSGDPYAVSYKELTSKTEMAGRGFDLYTWGINPPARGPEIDGTFIRRYQEDDYPLPQFDNYPHLTRRHMGFPVFLGGSKEVAKVPYEGSTGVVKYVPLDAPAGDRDETFKDTIAVDLNDFSTTARYHVAVYEGPPDMSENADGTLRYDEAPVLDITIERRYIDTRDMTFSTSVGKSSVITPQAVGNPLNKQFGELFSNERGAYFYEVNARDISGQERPAVFEVKEFLAENRVELLFNNDVLDLLREPGITDPSMTEAYYTVTIVESQVPLKNEETDWNNYYSKFSPHFANAAARQDETWEYGITEAKPYEIATQRNLYNIAMGTDATAYLGNHYQQTQDIRLSAKKADAAIANQAPGSIGVSQYNTAGASPTAAKATVMRQQTERQELWTESIGAVDPGITELGFRGTYTAADPSATPSDPDEITGGYRLMDTRTDIKASIFGRASPEAKISNVSYELNPLTTSGTVETSQNEVTAAPGVKALLIEENMGTADNIVFANAADGRTKTVTLPSGAEMFALVIGETASAADGFAQLPMVRRIAVEDGYQIKPDTTSNTALTMGTVIGRVSGGADLELLESAATITLAQSSSSLMPEDAIGLLVGEIKGEVQSDGTGIQPVSLTKALAAGNVTIGMPLSNKAIGGVVGKIQDTDVILESVVAGTLDPDGNPEAQISLSSTRTAAGTGAVGGIVGTVRGGNVILKDSASYYKISTKNVTDNVIGGIIGSVEASDIPAAEATKVLLASDSNASVLLEDNGRGSNILGGVIGQVTGAAEVGLNGVQTGDAGAEDDIYAIIMKTDYTGGTGGNRIAGGIIGKVSGPDAVVEMTDVTNRLSILADDSRGRSGYYLGGLIGSSEHAILYLHDSDETEDSNLVNQGRISLTNRNTSSNKVYAAGGIGYMKDSPADVFGMRNTGDVTVTADDDNMAYNGSEVSIAGVMGYAEGKLEGIAVDDIAGTITVSEALSIRESLNTGAIRDERNMPDITGSSTAAGIIAVMEGDLASADTRHPVQIVYNHNAGDIRGIRAAGILADISEDWKGTIVKTDTSDTIETPVEVRYNINISPIDAGYEEEEVEDEENPVRVITGSDITLVYELPLAKAFVEGVERELDGYDIAELLEAEYEAIEIPDDATPSNATPSNATPSNATPSNATPSNIAYYNAGLEDMVKAPDYDSESELPVIPADRVSGAILSLGQMQSLTLFQEETKWDDEVIDDEFAAYLLIPPKWIMTEGQGPGITQNRYIPPGGFGRLAPAPRLLQAETVPMEVTVRTWELVEVATASNATDSDASEVEYELVETEKVIEADGIELSWEYTGIVSADGMSSRSGVLLATASDAMMSEMAMSNATMSNATMSNALRVSADSEEEPEFEFAVIWEAGGRVLYVMETGVLEPDGSDTYHFTITPEMAAEVAEYLSYEGELAVQISIGVIIDGRVYRGVSETVTLELMALEQTQAAGTSISKNRAYLNWLEDDSLSDYSDEVQFVVNYGMSRMGDPYSRELAGVGDYVDCSYFVKDSYRQLGIELPRTAAAQAQYLENGGLTVSGGNLRPGDLIYYSFDSNGRYKNVSHVAMYVGNGMVVDASSSRGEVVTREIYGLGSVVTYARPLVSEMLIDDVTGFSDEIILES